MIRPLAESTARPTFPYLLVSCSSNEFASAIPEASSRGSSASCRSRAALSASSVPETLTPISRRPAATELSFTIFPDALSTATPSSPYFADSPAISVSASVCCCTSSRSSRERALSLCSLVRSSGSRTSGSIACSRADSAFIAAIRADALSTATPSSPYLADRPAMIRAASSCPSAVRRVSRESSFRR